MRAPTTSTLLTIAVLTISITIALRPVHTVLNIDPTGARGTASTVRQSGHIDCTTSSAGPPAVRPCSADLLSVAQRPLSPGVPATTTITLTDHTGPRTADLYLHAARPCQQVTTQKQAATPQDLCDRIRLTIRTATTLVYDGSLTHLATSSPQPLPIRNNQNMTLTITTTLDPSAGNAYQGLTTIAPLTLTATQTSA